MAQDINDRLAAFTASDVRRRAAGALVRPDGARRDTAPERAGRGDHDLTPELGPGQDGADPVRPAAVLVPIIDRGPEATVLLTRRTEHLPTHAGQIAFPGGKIEAADASPLETALREAREEVGLDAAFVEVVGFLDTYRTATGFHIAPAVAIVSPGFTLEIDRTEVAEAFEVPLGFLMDEANHRTHSRQWRGRRRRFYAMPYGDRYIWGATAGILRNLYDWLYR